MTEQKERQVIGKTEKQIALSLVQRDKLLFFYWNAYLHACAFNIGEKSLFAFTYKFQSLYLK
jgi:hypothetical protein